MAVSPQQVLTDPRFQAMTPEQKRAILLRIDPNFARLSPSQQEMVVLRGSATKVTASGKEIPSKPPTPETPKKATYLEDFENWARRTGETRQLEADRFAAAAPVRRGPSGRLESSFDRDTAMRAGEAQLAPNILADLSKTVREVVTPANLGLAGLTAAFPSTALATIPYFAGQGAIGAATPQQPGESPQEALRRRLMSGATVPLALAGGGEAGKAFLERRAATPGSRIGAISRAKGILNTLESRYKDSAIDFSKPLAIAKQAAELDKQGYNLPKPMADFIKWIEQGSKAKPIPGRPGEFIDQPASDPLLFTNARNFIKALNDSVNWEDFGGRKGTMGRLATQMIESLTDSIKQVMHPRDAQFYEQAMRDYSIGKGMQNLWGTLGKFGGRVATYGSGVPHAWAFGHVGSRIGEGLAGSLAKSVSEFESPRTSIRGPETETEMIGRGATEANPFLNDAVRLSNTIEQLERLRHRQYQEFLKYDPKVPGSQPPTGDFMTTTAQISQLKEQLAKVRAANPAQFPSEYKGAPQATSKQGGAGANYTKEQLDALKADLERRRREGKIQ